MAAHFRRRHFAAPLVVTFVAACTETVPIAENPPTASSASVAASVAPTPSASATADASAAPSTAGEWLITKSGDVCSIDKKIYPCPNASEFPAVVRRWAGYTVCTVRTSPTMHCEPTATCNPPSPTYEKVPCPD